MPYSIPVTWPWLELYSYIRRTFPKVSVPPFRFSIRNRARRIKPNTRLREVCDFMPPEPGSKSRKLHIAPHIPKLLRASGKTFQGVTSELPEET